MALSLIQSSAILGAAPAMFALRETIRVAAEVDEPVLIMGETGTGKELVARRIHALSRRGDRPCFTVNMPALPAELVESELFGHMKGAFTGADRDRAGVFEEADGGTLFLDEIGDFPLALQSKLLRALESGETKRLGMARPARVDVRVIAATNAPLEERVAERKFRSDLYYRLNVLPIVIPSLRDRIEDIPALARHFLNEMPGGADRIVSEDAIAALKRHLWPGNVRELRNLVRRAAVFTGGKITGAHVAKHLTGNAEPKAKGGDGSCRRADGSFMTLTEHQEIYWRTLAAQHPGFSCRKLAVIAGVSVLTAATALSRSGIAR